MKKIKIFLASSNELVKEREAFEIKIYRKSKMWSDKKGISLHLDIWEDLTASVSQTRSQDEYDKKVRKADLFVLLAFSKVGMYTEEEFDVAHTTFKAIGAPRIFTYFLAIDKEKEETSLGEFKNKLNKLGHFETPCSDFNDFWNKFNDELERFIHDFEKKSHDQKEKGNFNVDNRGANIKNQFHGGTFDKPTFN
jgi:hypothetical protein